MAKVRKTFVNFFNQLDEHFESETSLGAATLLRPLFPRPFPPGSGESVNLKIKYLSLLYFLRGNARAMINILIKTIKFVFDIFPVCLGKSVKAGDSDCQPCFFWRGAKVDWETEFQYVNSLRGSRICINASGKRWERDFLFGTIVFCSPLHLWSLHHVNIYAGEIMIWITLSSFKADQKYLKFTLCCFAFFPALLWSCQKLNSVEAGAGGGGGGGGQKRPNFRHFRSN